MPAAQATSVLAKEIGRFDALADRWWDPAGPMRALHRINPARIGWIAERLGRLAPRPSNVQVLDVGCGGGLAAEALARRRFAVTGIDASAELITAAERHAAGKDLSLTYRVATAEALLAEGARYDAVLALEVVEHVADPGDFVRTLAGLTAPGGMLILSTLNRTARSFLAAKVGAEYLLRWLPLGTHDWRAFLAPAELAALVRGAGARVADLAGLSCDPLGGRWRISRDLSINYLLAAEAG
jgi:2-polyprenyl-6-hydroxyphenyl methylase/3-demethylubiquinone-9 3-methyltransferase